MQIGNPVKEQAWSLLKHSVNGVVDPYVRKSMWRFVYVSTYSWINERMLWT